jgi:diguanylate cyclase (GGDEF)-like protein
MTLHRKAVLVMLAATVTVAVASIMVSKFVLMPSLLAYEQHAMQERIETVNATMEHAIQDLNDTAADYAIWDLTYDYMLHGGRKYEQAAFNETSFQNYDIQLVMLISTDGRVVLEKQFMPLDRIPLDAEDVPAIRETVHQMQTRISEGAAVRGLIATGSAPFYVVMRPILPSRASGPSAGMMVMVRRIDSNEIDDMEQIAHVTLATCPYQSTMKLLSSSRMPLLALRRGAQAWMGRSESQISGYLLVRDVQGKPATFLRLTSDRTVYDRTRRLIWLATALVSGVAILLGLAQLWFLHSLVLSRLDKASKMVRLITNQVDFSFRIPITKDDELGVLARAMNTMLDELERSRNKLLELHAASEFDALHDALTGLKNRRAIRMVMELEMGRALRENTTLGVLLADVDHFKCINDTYGHGVGDTVLCSVAEALDSGLRPYDAAGRYGGEEFLILVPGVNHVRAMAIADRLRKMVEQSVKVEGKAVTVSIGVAVTMGNDTPEAVIEAADTSLYSAKAAGRNRVEMLTAAVREMPQLVREYSGA